MHTSALRLGHAFFQTYGHAGTGRVVVEVGSQDVNGSLRAVVPAGVEYVGLDFVAAPGVDIVLDDPYSFPLADRSVDYVVTTSCLEHSQMFWLTFLEALRILKDDGLFYMNVPSNGAYHPYPRDSWRFYPDAGLALAEWARRSGYAAVMLESFTNEQEGDIWNDFVAVFAKTESGAALHGERLFHAARNPKNIWLHGESRILNPEPLPQDIRHNNVFLMFRGAAQAVEQIGARAQESDGSKTDRANWERLFEAAAQQKDRETADLRAATNSLVQAVEALSKIGAHGISLNESLMAQLARAIEHGQRLESLISLSGSRKRS